VQVVGWSWTDVLTPSVVDYYTLPGDPALPETWDLLLERIAQGYEHPTGTLLVPRLIGVDSGGLHTSQVYAFARMHKNKGFFATKGMNTGSGPVIFSRATKVDYRKNGKVFKKGGEMWRVYPDTGKSWLYGRLRQDALKRGLRFPSDLPLKYFEQLTAEHFDPKKKRWVNPGAKRNEALDTFVLALAAAYHPLLRLDAAKAAQFARMLERLKPPDKPAEPPPVRKPAPKVKPIRRGKGFATNW
jgi:phage terminase large subunit GpA-like protein